MVQTPEKMLTLAQFLQLPETKPASEYSDRQIIQKPMPQGKHSAIQGEFVTAINCVVKPERIARAFPELRCTFGERSLVPDIVVFTWDRIPRDGNGEIANTFSLAPDWTIEILSPTPSQTKVTKTFSIVYTMALRWAGGSISRSRLSLSIAPCSRWRFLMNPMMGFYLFLCLPRG